MGETQAASPQQDRSLSSSRVAMVALIAESRRRLAGSWDSDNEWALRRYVMLGLLGNRFGINSRLLACRYST